MRISELAELRSRLRDATVVSLGRFDNLVDAGDADVPFCSDLKPNCCLTWARLALKVSSGD